jgi:hypothetical protein
MPEGGTPGHLLASGRTSQGADEIFISFGRTTRWRYQVLRVHPEITRLVRTEHPFAPQFAQDVYCAIISV